MTDKRMFMIDIESTGVDIILDDILEIAIVQMDWVAGYWSPGVHYQTYVHCSKEPESEFAKKHMVEVYRQANRAEKRPARYIRNEIVDFLDIVCHRKGHDVIFCGWNLQFDLGMLHQNNMLQRPGIVNDLNVGDHHYRTYEMSGAISLACDVTGLSREDLIAEAAQAYPMDLPDGKEHQALFDCYKQIKTLNGVIRLVRDNRL